MSNGKAKKKAIQKSVQMLDFTMKIAKYTKHDKRINLITSQFPVDGYVKHHISRRAKKRGNYRRKAIRKTKGGRLRMRQVRKRRREEG